MSLLEVEKAVLPYIHIVLPLLYVVCSLLLSRLFKFSFLLVLVLGCLPYLAQRFELPFSDLVESQHPLILTVYLWGILAAILFGVLVSRFFLTLLQAGSQFVGALMWLGAFAALAVTTLLVINPEFLNSNIPDWKEAYGIVLFSCAVAACCISLIRFAKASVFIAVWSVVCVLMGSELFFNTLPSELLDRALSAKSPDLSNLVANYLLEQNEPETNDDFEIAVLGSGAQSSNSLLKDLSYTEVLERILNSSAVEPGFSVKNYLKPNSSLVQTREFVKQNSFDKKPSLALVSGWYEESQKTGNSLGIPGLSELEALSYLDRQAWLSDLSIIRKILESKTYKALKLSLSGHPEVGAVSEPSRVSPEEYTLLMKETLETLQSNQITPVVIHEPVEASLNDLSQSYLQATLKAAEALKVPVIMLGDVLKKYGNDKLFLAENKLTAKGHQVVAESLFEAIGMLADKLSLTNEVRRALADPIDYPAVKFVKSFPTEKIGEELEIELALPPERQGYYKATFALNQQSVKSKKLNEVGEVKLSFPAPAKLKTSPFTTVSLQLGPSHGEKEDYLGDKQIAIPAKISIEAAEGRNLVFTGLNNMVASPDGLLARLDPETGELHKHLSLAAPEAEISRFIKSTPWGHFVAIAAPSSKEIQRASNSKVYNYIGLKDFANEDRPLAFLGVAGAKVSELKAQPDFSKLEFGSKKFSRFSRMKVLSIKSGDNLLYKDTLGIRVKDPQNPPQ
ncbi:MAG: hypothetical protein R3A13_03625 [Bdellovibrionota bacterium]